MAYDIDKIRKQLKDKIGTRPQDPNEFRPPKAKTGEEIKIRFYVLGPLMAGDKCFDGTATKDMEVFAVKHGSHWVDNRPYACPRMNMDESCELCETGFQLLKEVEDKVKRQAIIKQWLAQSVYSVNIYFPPFKSNPENLRGKVMFFHAPKTCFDHWYAALNRDTGGDAIDPDAFGVFYDEYAAFLYQLEVIQSGNNNSYKTSKFLASVGARPIAAAADGTPDVARIQAILDQRHDLWTKIDTPDPSKIRRLCHKILGHEDDVIEPAASTADAGTTVAEGELEQVAPAPKPAAAPQKPATAAAPQKPAAAPQKPATAAAPQKPAPAAAPQKPAPAAAPQKPAPAAAQRPAPQKPAPQKPAAAAPAPEAAEFEPEPDAGAPAAAEAGLEAELEEVEQLTAPARPPAKPAPTTNGPAKAPQKPAAKAAAPTRPAPAKPAVAVEETSSDNDNIDGLLARLTPIAPAAEEEVAQ